MSPLQLNPLITAALLAALSVALGAFGAHALSDAFSPKQLSLWQTATDYLQFHALALLVIGCRSKPRSWPAVSILLGLGCVLFSGSLYALALGAPRLVGALTPLGGMCFISAWLLIAWYAWQSQFPDTEDSGQ